MSILIKNKVPETLYRVMDNNGDFIDQNYQPKLDINTIINSYYFMNLSREKDKKMLRWQRTGKMLTFAPCMGEEALQIGVSLAMQQGDWLLPNFRSDCIMAHRMVPLHQLFMYWAGHEGGSAFSKDLNILPVNITIGAQISQAAGIGYMLKYKQTNNVAVTFIGDGGTAEGEFMEALNVASIHKWNTLVCVNNNQFAISTRTHNESAVSDLSLKALALGIPRARVDGNDIFACYDAAKDALDYVRSGMGPVLIEFVTYRLGPHTTSDDPTVYRTNEEVAEATKSDPIDRLRKWLIKNNYWNDTNEMQMKQQIDNVIESEFKVAQQKLNVSIDKIFDNQFAQLPNELQEQKAIAKHYFEK